ncbi:MAG: OmpA family protein [Sphingobacteriaceae bacterium]
MRKVSKLMPLSLLAILMAGVLFTSCKAKKVAPPPPPPVEVVAPTPPPPPPKPVDTDMDGVVDSIDQCPTVAGLASNNGCPPKPEPSFAFQNILFEFNSSVIKTSSYSMLDEMSALMRQYPDKQFQVNGHASSEGTETRNMTLSVDRANAVKAYLVNSGVNAANLATQGFGATEPLNGNTTETERMLNRRVEIKKQ